MDLSIVGANFAGRGSSHGGGGGGSSSSAGCDLSSKNERNFQGWGVDLPLPFPPTIVLFARFATKQDTWP